MSASLSTSELDELNPLLLSSVLSSKRPNTELNNFDNNNSSNNIDEDMLIEALGISAVIGYESETNHCIGLCKKARQDYNLLLSCTKTTVESYRKKHKHRIMYSCMTGNVEWFRKLYELGNKNDIIALLTKDNKSLYHLLTMNPYDNYVEINHKLGIQFGDEDSEIHFIVRWESDDDEIIHNTPSININGRLAIIDILSKTSLSIMLPDNYGNTCVGTAIKFQEVEIVKALLQYVHVDDLNNVNERGKSLLHMAISVGNISIINHLCNLQGINMMIQDEKFYKPVQYAVEKDNVEVMEALLQYHDKFDINMVDGINHSLAHYAVENDSVNILPSLASVPNINLDMKNDYGNTPLLLAVLSHKTSIVRVLLQYRNLIDINSQNNDGNTALHVACEKRQADIVDLLLEAGCNLSIRNNHGYIPFHSACAIGDIDILRKLLFHKDTFDINTTDADGNTALDIAMKKNQYNICQVLKEAGINTTTI